MSVKLNQEALSHAKGLLRRGEITHDDRDDWSEHAPSTDENNTFIDKHGMAEYAKWHLGEDTDQTEGTRGRYPFPYGDCKKLHRCAVISGESRAGQYDHPTIKTALKKLLTSIDEKAPQSDRRGAPGYCRTRSAVVIKERLQPDFGAAAYRLHGGQLVRSHHHRDNRHARRDACCRMASQRLDTRAGRGVVSRCHRHRRWHCLVGLGQVPRVRFQPGGSGPSEVLLHPRWSGPLPRRDGRHDLCPSHQPGGMIHP